ncbi:XRE family transcriptional regulator [Clostridiaceae bacterium]|nr:XRE family transcriptional regulator [Clostridiaceae bacterium]
MYEKYIALRDKKGVSDYRVAVDTGITKSTFTDWKNGRSKPKADKLAALAKYFGVPIEYFLEQDAG